MTLRTRITLHSVAAFGLFVPNGLFLHFTLTRFSTFADAAMHPLALGFIIDAFMATALLAWYFAKHPIGRHSWTTFVLLSLTGGLGFSLPFYYYLNKRNTGADERHHDVTS